MTTVKDREPLPAPNVTRYWRIRMNYPGDNVTRDAWQEGVAGIWYGAWKPEQFEETLNLSKGEGSERLTRINIEAGLTWEVTGSCLDTARRFWRIRECDWVFTYFDDSIHLARVTPEVERNTYPKYTRKKELL